MSKWVAEDMLLEISKICKCFSENNFEKLIFDENLDVKASEGIKRGILEYLCGDVLDERALKRVGIPDREYIIERANLYEVDPGAPSELSKRIQLDLIIDGVESDLTLVVYAYKRVEGSGIRVYGVRTL
ncbi:hypothetical protein BLA13014_03718 [Burkholderia aenigmatica]|uniref:Uncharacterized protein n=1 Tax=Burkholderia aenigmatica TaxID=2015348 RepID=A0A6P2MG23_9BURK|nr:MULTISPECIES: hypothetical protein [Burkholderia]VWB80852.1 hypothetical protein BLA13014_03718 [Burkholderia aenigmatica]